MVPLSSGVVNVIRSSPELSNALQPPTIPGGKPRLLHHSLYPHLYPHLLTSSKFCFILKPNKEISPAVNSKPNKPTIFLTPQALIISVSRGNRKQGGGDELPALQSAHMKPPGEGALPEVTAAIRGCRRLIAQDPQGGENYVFHDDLYLGPQR